MKDFNYKMRSAAAVMTACVIMLAGCSGNNGKDSADEPAEETTEAQAEAADDDSNEASEAGSDVSSMAALTADCPGYISDKLGLPEDAVLESDPSTMNNSHAYEGEYYSLTLSDYPNIECMIYDDADEARAIFEEYYNEFTDAFNEETFEGEYQCVYEDDHGYIVIDGMNSGTGIFGDRFAFGDTPLYAGVYYEGNTFIRIMPKNDITSAEDVISSLELPMANGDNC